ncbi:MAG TPA: Ycf66 family protein [Xenococcaceae cyanobacterium]
MVNFGLNSASILGLFLAVAGASLYFLRSVRPELSRDHDIFFAAVGLLCGFILLFQGWRLDPILQFGQFLLSGSAIFFAVESIRLRGVATEQARRNTPTVDRDRPVSRTRVYREAESERDRIPDAYGYEDAQPNYDSPRLRGYDDPEPQVKSSRRRPIKSSEPDSYPSRRRKSTPAPSDRYRPERPNNWSTPRLDMPTDRRHPSRSERQYPPRTDYPDGFAEDGVRSDRYYEEPPRNKPRSSPLNPSDLGRSYEAEDRGKRDESDQGRNFTAGMGRSYDEGIGKSYDPEDEVVTTDYVDYQPMDEADYPEATQDWESEQSYPSDEPSDWTEKQRRERPRNDEY